ncbi:uncharacterized protein PAC_08090 [Phialocephala subalpina]|uniref:Uncharacterized protein n=1 Tax=Phialocephala subalpina TaxID=576137 RepID=A0A1L7WZJ7_9HELO|nr:uncharacterized protein PAC_08090 [Phialocephala subalpina]
MSTQTKTKSSSHHHHSSHKSSSKSSSTSSTRQYYLITEAPLRATSETTEIDLQAESWKLPYSIDDSDLTFDGKPLNMLYEENRWMAEHVNGSGGSGDYHYSSSGSSSSSGKEHKSRGRSRQSKK